MKLWLLIFLWLSVLLSAHAIDTHTFNNPQQQEAYESLTSQLRCLVCQNQTIADSNAELAADLRRQVYEMLQQGKSYAEIVQFMTDRYGDFVLYNPPFKAKTGLLWLGPLLFLGLGLIGLYRFTKRKKNTASDDEIKSEKLAKIRSLLDEGDVS
ncbi:MAG: cytochrome c-type biogenesis protein CcmH [Methylovulum sp.]|jgi:cytochrome c-type biogenesis protein CcmH|nr:cytochrome c-type biogenesis protein CcmH [Methylovulum sp.]MCF7997486.1 cytochrome c-type biogenesis protein CcmH [Methylovulum sp.]MCF8006680.1 cytochrome c-type biogenesis protein CcmH [Methylovulum sp.]